MPYGQKLAFILLATSPDALRAIKSLMPYGQKLAFILLATNPDALRAIKSIMPCGNDTILYRVAVMVL